MGKVHKIDGEMVLVRSKFLSFFEVRDGVCHPFCISLETIIKPIDKFCYSVILNYGR